MTTPARRQPPEVIHGHPDRPDTIHLKAQPVSGQAHLPAESPGLLASEQPSEAFSGPLAICSFLKASE